jgi:hypothetical protein
VNYKHNSGIARRAGALRAVALNLETRYYPDRREAEPAILHQSRKKASVAEQVYRMQHPDFVNPTDGNTIKAIAIPHDYRPEIDRTFLDWCDEAGIETVFTGLPAFHLDDPWPTWTNQYTKHHSIWLINAPDSGHVAVKLRWSEEMLEPGWTVTNINKTVAEMLQWPIGDQI